MKAGVIGYGSIGKRHISNLLSAGIGDITLYRELSRGNALNLREIYDFKDFLNEDFDFIIVSNPTTYHFNTIEPLIKDNRNLLVEKPLVFTSSEATSLNRMLQDYTGTGMVAYNMRFHPCISRIKSLLDENFIGKIYSSRLFVGQYLPDWRPGTDYSKGVSALKSLGGGVVFELIHEIDLAFHLFGKPESEIRSLAARLSSLDIETEDISEIIYRSVKDVFVSIHQDYLTRDYKRTIEITAELGSLYCDLKTSEITVTGEKGEILLKEAIPFERNDMYLNLVKYFCNCISTGSKPEPGLNTGLESVKAALEIRKSNNL